MGFAGAGAFIGDDPLSEEKAPVAPATTKTMATTIIIMPPKIMIFRCFMQSPDWVGVGPWLCSSSTSLASFGLDKTLSSGRSPWVTSPGGSPACTALHSSDMTKVACNNQHKQNYELWKHSKRSNCSRHKFSRARGVVKLIHFPCWALRSRWVASDYVALWNTAWSTIIAAARQFGCWLIGDFQCNRTK